MDHIIHSDVRLTWIYLRYICAPPAERTENVGNKKGKGLYEVKVIPTVVPS